MESTEEDFSKSYVVKYARFRDAIFAKKKLDEKEFFGGILHVCYAPELEEVKDTRMKLEGRRRYVESKRGDAGKWRNNNSDTRHGRGAKFVQRRDKKCADWTAA